jgi:hypothetical protein
VELDHVKEWDRLAEERFGPTPAPDPAQVQRRVHAYLVQRGRDLARDPALALDLDHASDEDLAELGRLDAIAQAPELPPDVATYWAMFEAEQDQAVDQYLDQYHQRHEQHRHHGHGVNEPCPHELDQAQTAPEPGTTEAPEIERFGAAPAAGDGQVGSRARGDWKDRVRKEGLDPVTEYLKNVPDEPDEKWS